MLTIQPWLRLTLGFISLHAAASAQGETWHYYRPSNTGIQGDYCEAIWIGTDDDPWIGGYDPGFEEGGVAKCVQSEDRWINISNVDHPIIGHPEDTGTSRVSDIVADAQGWLWMATGRGALRFDPTVGAATLVKYDASNSALPGGWTEDAELAPDGTLWFAARSVFWGGGGIARYEPSTQAWTGWPAVGDHLSAQPKSDGSYYVWNGESANGYVQRFDSSTQTWTQLPMTGAPGEVVALPGKTCTDASGNFWALRVTSPGQYHSLDYRRVDGTWVTPLEPYPAVTFDIWVFRAFGNQQALLVDGNSRTWRFDGTAWNDLGVWRDGAFSYAANIDSAGSVWVSGVGGAAKRDALTGAWQRYRVTNTSQYGFWNDDLALDEVTGDLYAGGNAGTGVGGMMRFDGQRWQGWNSATYGLGFDWSFLNDNCHALCYRPSNGRMAVSPLNWLYGIHEWTGSDFQPLLANGGAQRLCEDSLGRLWALGEYYSLKYYDGTSWTEVGLTAWGSKIQRDPLRAGTVWAATGHEIKRTDGSYSFSRGIHDFPELNPQSDTFSGLASAPGGTAWIGASVNLGAGGSGGALIHIDSNDGSYQMLRYDHGWPLPGQFVQPLAVTPDGRVWMQYDSDFLTAERGLCWYDGINVGVYPAPPNGEPQWGGLPHAGITDMEVREITGGYELWISCASRGIAKLTVYHEPPGTVFCAGDGASVPCPCGNESAAGDRAGCENSSGSGATLRASGTKSVAYDDCVLSVAHLPTQKFGLLFMGAGTTSGMPFGDGVRCVNGHLFRYPLSNSGATGSFSYGPDLIATSQDRFHPSGWIRAGSTWNFQAWYRDPMGPCGSGSNVSNAISLSFVP